MTLKNKLVQVKNNFVDCSKEIEKLKKKIPFFIGVVILLSFSAPYIPGRQGRQPLIEKLEYHEAVLFYFIIMAITLSIFYLWKMNKLKKELRELKLKIHLIEEELSE